jgi:hypothetical protein
MLNGDSDDEDAEWEMPVHDGLHAKEVRSHCAARHRRTILACMLFRV